MTTSDTAEPLEPDFDEGDLELGLADPYDGDPYGVHEEYDRDEQARGDRDIPWLHPRRYWDEVAV